MEGIRSQALGRKKKAISLKEQRAGFGKNGEGR
jgi:hypothetical protein